MGRLTTHVLDTARGCPARGVAVSLYRISPERQLLCESQTNADGRLDAPMLENESFTRGKYELVFSVGEYFRQHQPDLPDPAFVDEVVLRFGIANCEQHYHVPLLVSPWSYSTYRGS